MFSQSCFINFETPSILANYNYNFFYGDDGTGSRFLSISVESILDICMEYFVIVFACRIAYLLCGGSIRGGDLAGPRRRGACSHFRASNAHGAVSESFAAPCVEAAEYIRSCD